MCILLGQPAQVGKEWHTCEKMVTRPERVRWTVGLTVSRRNSAISTGPEHSPWSVAVLALTYRRFAWARGLNFWPSVLYYPRRSKLKSMEDKMPGFLDKLKSGADKAAFEADRLVRINQAQSALKAMQRELEAEVAALGQQALALYDAGTLTQSELLALGPKIDDVRQRIAAQEAEVERIRQEKPPEAAPAQERPAATAEADVAPEGRVCPNCQTPLSADVRFCPECGAKVAEG